MRLYIFARAVFAPIIKLLYRVKVTGEENVPSSPFIAFANHTSAVDPILLACTVKQPLHFIAKQSLVKNGFIRWLFLKLGMIFVARDGKDISAVKSMIALVRKGESIGIFPQGTRITDAPPSPSQAVAGFAAVAMTTKTTLLPITIVSSGKMPKMFSRTNIIIHPAMSYEEYTAFKEKPTREEVCRYCFEKVCRPFEVK